MAPTVLLIDDDPLTRVLFKRHLENAGYRFRTAENAEQGLAIVETEKPDLIVLDVMMAEKDGLSALRELKAGDSTKGIPIIILSGSVNDMHHIVRKEAQACGAAAFFTKPISPPRLVTEISRIIPIARQHSS